ncbi:MAG: hypothetical protein KDJ80_06685 [Nitratireductor sp.]|nr:hypothetical protein [Nitratireductor sp.]
MQHWYLAAPLAWLVILATRRLAEPDFLAAGSSERSNHTGRPQQIGGFALICCVAVPAILGAITAPAVLPVAAGWLLLFALGLFDDLYDWSAGIKFAVQLLAATLIVLALVPAAPATMLLLAACAIVALAYWINAVNFMDGLDWMLAAGLGIPLAAASLLLLASAPSALSPFAYAGLWSAAGLAGFALWNAPPAKVFMGDSGALLLGGVSGTLILLLCLHGSPAAAIIPFLHFLFDTLRTIAIRLKAGENIFRAHSRHAYQTAFRSGLAARAIALRVALLSLALSAIAALAVWLDSVFADAALLALALLMTAWFDANLRNRKNAV